MFHIYDIKINELENPLGLDIKSPRFSWKLRSEKQNTMQKKAQILVGTTPGASDVWDSGVMENDCSIGTAYTGKELKPETRYEVTVKVWNQEEELAEGHVFFETGMLNPHISAWEGAEWIGAPEFAVAADTIGVFVIESVICVEKAAGQVLCSEQMTGG